MAGRSASSRPLEPPDDNGPPEGRRAALRRVLALGAPLIGLGFLRLATTLADTVMCGWLPNGAVALGALGFAVTLLNLAFLLADAVAVTAAAFIARAHGAGDAARCSELLRTAVVTTVVVWLLVAVIGNVLAPVLFSALGASGPVLSETLRYFRPMLGLGLFAFLDRSLAAALRATGNTRLPFISGVVANAVNVPVSLGLMFGWLGLPALGVLGAALGTICATFVSTGILAVYLSRSSGIDAPVRLCAGPVRLPQVWRFVRFSLPVVGQRSILHMSILASVALLGHLDARAVAANLVAARINLIAVVFGSAMANASAALAGNALGAGNTQLARRTAGVSVSFTSAVLLLAALLLYATASPVTESFGQTSGTPTHDLSVTCLRILAVGMPALGAYLVLSGLFIGAGKPRIALLITLITTLAVQIPVSVGLGLGLGFGPFGVWIGELVGLSAKLLLAIFAYRQTSRWARTGAD